MGGMAGPPQGRGTGPKTKRVSGAGLSPVQHRKEGEPMNQGMQTVQLSLCCWGWEGSRQRSSEGQRLQTDGC